MVHVAKRCLIEINPPLSPFVKGDLLGSSFVKGRLGGINEVPPLEKGGQGGFINRYCSDHRFISLPMSAPRSGPVIDRSHRFWQRTIYRGSPERVHSTRGCEIYSELGGGDAPLLFTMMNE